MDAPCDLARVTIYRLAQAGGSDGQGRTSVVIRNDGPACALPQPHALRLGRPDGGSETVSVGSARQPLLLAGGALATLRIQHPAACVPKGQLPDPQPGTHLLLDGDQELTVPAYLLDPTCRDLRVSPWLRGDQS